VEILNLVDLVITDLWFFFAEGYLHLRGETFPGQRNLLLGFYKNSLWGGAKIPKGGIVCQGDF
jgi:hypothetical protein